LKQKEKRIVFIALVVSVLLGIIKFMAYFSTRSVAILSDALESIVNILSGGFAFYSIYLAGQPRDKNHPYGHGKVEFLSIGMEGAMLFLAGCLILYKAGEYFLYPRTIDQLDYGVFLLGFTALANLVVGELLRASGRKIPSITLSGHGKHLRTDGWSTIALICALILIRISSWRWVDPTASLLIGLFVLRNAFQLIRPSVSGLMDETDLKILDEVILILHNYRMEDWVDIHNLRIQKYGNNYHLDCHLTLPYYLELEKADQQIKALSSAVSRGISVGEVECFIQTDPCVPSCCPYCIKKDCPVRHSPFTGPMPWTRETLLPNRKHGETEK